MYQESTSNYQRRRKQPPGIGHHLRPLPLPYQLIPTNQSLTKGISSIVLTSTDDRLISDRTLTLITKTSCSRHQ